MTPCPASPCAGWGRAKAKADAPSHSNPHFPCLRPRTCPPKTAPLPAYGRITVCKGGSAQGNPRPCPCVLPASARLRPCTLPADGRSAERRVGEDEGKGGRPFAQSPALSLPTAPPSPACVPNHCAQRRKCTRQSPPLPVRSPRGSLSTAVPLPLVCRIAVRKDGVHKAIPAPARAFSPRQPAYGRALAR